MNPNRPPDQRSSKHEVESKEVFTIEKLLEEWSALEEKYDAFIDGADTEEERVEIQARLREAKERFIQTLIAEKDRFSRVFETEKASLYVLTAEGRVVRFKKREVEQGMFEYRVQRPTDHLFFLDSVTAAEFIQLRSQHSTIINQSFKIAEYKVGVHPIEFVLADDEYSLDVTNDHFTIVPKADRGHSFQPSLPNHIGHAITRIYK